MENKRFQVIKFNKKNIIYILCIVVNTVLAITLSQLFSHTIDLFTAKSSINKVYTMLLALFIVTVLNAIVDIFFAQYLPLKKQLKKTIVTTKETLDLILKLDLKSFEQKDKGYFINLSMNSTASFADNSVQMNINFIGSIICALIIIGYATYINIWFGVLFCLYVPLYYAVIKYPSKKLANMQKVGLSTQDAYINEIKRIVEDKRIINIDHADNYFLKYYDKVAAKFLKYITDYRLFEIITTNLPKFLSNLCQIIILVISAYLFYTDNISVGTILLMYQLSSLFQIPLSNGFDYLIFYQASSVHFNRLDELDAMSKIDNTNKMYSDINNLVEIENGSFYSIMDEDHHLFDINSLSINENELVLVKGTNGSGKSVFLEYLTGYFDVDCFKGKIKVNNKFKDVAFLSYPILLVNGDLKENLFGLEYNQELATMLNIDFSDKQINSQIRNLSYGEQQKLNLLRVLSYPSDILILDEPFTNLDAKTINNLTNYLVSIKNKKTVFVIDHSNNLDDYADKLLLIKDKNMNIEKRN